MLDLGDLFAHALHIPLFCAEASLFGGGRLFSPILLLSLFLRSATYCAAAMVLMVSNMSLAQASSRRTCALWSVSRLEGMAKVVLSDSMRAGCERELPGKAFHTHRLKTPGRLAA